MGLPRWRDGVKQVAERYLAPRLSPAVLREVGIRALPFSERSWHFEIDRQLERIATSQRPVLVGPWLSEVGFELLYWIPFLSWARARWALPRDRLVVVSRGGVAPWYRRIAEHYVDVFDLVSPEEFRVENERRAASQGGALKHRSASPFDRRLIEKAMQRLGLGDVDVLHPSLMYRLFATFWLARAPAEYVAEFVIHERFESVSLGDLTPHVPEEFVAVRLYFNASFPDTEANRSFASRIVVELAEHAEVVLLTTGMSIDDHAEFRPETTRRVHSVAHLMTPRDNLDIQTRLISHATAFVGTYGGLSYLPPFLGVHSLAFYSHPGEFRGQHLDVARRAFHTLSDAAYVPLDIRDLDVLGKLLSANRRRLLPEHA